MLIQMTSVEQNVPSMRVNVETVVCSRSISIMAALMGYEVVGCKSNRNIIKSTHTSHNALVRLGGVSI